MTTKRSYANLETETETNPTMDATIQTPTQQVTAKPPVAGMVTLDHVTGNLWHLQWTPEGKTFDPAQDLSLGKTIASGKAGMEAIADFLEGRVRGSSTLLIVAPATKLAWANPNGVVGHVHSDHDITESVEVDVNGNKLLMAVQSHEDIPTEFGWKRLYMTRGGMMYGEAKDPVQTPRGERGGSLANIENPNEFQTRKLQNSWNYWYLETLSALCSGHCVSISVGPVTIEAARKVLAVSQAADPVAANAARKWEGRERSRITAGAKETREEIAVILKDGGQLPVSDYSVPKYGGGTLALDEKSWPKNQPVIIVTASGNTLDPIPLRSGTPAERLSIVEQVVAKGYSVRDWRDS